MTCPQSTQTTSRFISGCQRYILGLAHHSRRALINSTPLLAIPSSVLPNQLDLSTWSREYI